jgi:molybdopterin-guanine dinucleotide biosynthesis protein A
LDESSKENSIVDTFTGLGPFGGILSAFRYDPNCAYLSIPCDVPFIDESLIRNLIEHRDTSKVATCFHNKETDFPEPLITIWEPKAYSRLLYFLSLGYSCPRKVLINSDIKEIDPPHELSLFNANTPEESEFAVKKLAAIRPSEN